MTQTFSARSYLSLAAATTFAFTPMVLPPVQQPVALPPVVTPQFQLAVNAADIEAFLVDLQSVLDDATAGATEIAGVPGQTLIGVVNTIVATIDSTFTGLIDATGNQTIGALLTVVKTLSVDAFAKLAENLGLANPVITTTTTQVGELFASALTGSLRNAGLAVSDLANNPLSVASYAGLLDAGVATGRLLVGNGLAAVQSLGDAGFELAGIAVSEVTFQVNNLAHGLGALLTELGDASDNAVVEAVLGAVRSLAITPAVAVFNFGSSTVQSVLTTTQTGFDAVLGGATDLVGAPIAEPLSPEPVVTESVSGSSHQSVEPDPEVAIVPVEDDESAESVPEEDAVEDDSVVEDSAAEDPAAEDNPTTEDTVDDAGTEDSPAAETAKDEVGDKDDDATEKASHHSPADTGDTGEAGPGDGSGDRDNGNSDTAAVA